VNVDVGGRVRQVPVRVVAGAHVARVAVPPSAVMAVTIPHVEVHGVAYERVVVPSVVVVAALPGIIEVTAAPVIAVPAAPVIIVGKHRKHRKFRGGFFWH
jgi:hypothetical protein